jgi:hypothetical protein
MLDSMEFRPKISEEDEINENFAGALKLDPLPTEFATRKVKDLTSASVCFFFVVLHQAKRDFFLFV